ncbi:hypothetical protein GQ457_02G027140 [Hibiscus cannabinus]
MTINNSQGSLLPLVSEIERLFHQQMRDNIEDTTMYRENVQVYDQQHENAAGNVGAVVRSRAIRDHITPILDNLNPRIVAPEIHAPHSELKLSCSIY